MSMDNTYQYGRWDNNVTNVVVLEKDLYLHVYQHCENPEWEIAPKALEQALEVTIDLCYN